MKEKICKRAFVNFITIIFLLAVIIFLFRNDYREIFRCIKNISALSFLALLGMEIIYLFLDAAACYILIHSQFSYFKFRQAIGVTLLGIFGNTAAFSAGIIPLQSYYLYKYCIEVGETVGLMSLKYIFHKSAIFIYAAVMLFISKLIGFEIPNLMKYVYTGFAVCGIIIIFLILICSLPAVQRLLLSLTEKLPDTDKWAERKKICNNNLKSVYTESKNVLQKRNCCIKIFLVNLLKLSWFYTIPFACIKVLGFSGVTFAQTQVLASVMLLIIGVLPNAAGIGPSEFAFMLLFSVCLKKIEVSSALILYRLVTFFFPFLLSVVAFLRIKANITKET